MDVEKEQTERRRVQQQFGNHAAEYLKSEIHSSEASLSKLVDIIQPKPNWKVLDVATGAGHTAAAFASDTDHVTALDVTWPMLITTRQQTASKGLLNIELCQGAAEVLPFKKEIFDLILCRTAAHHFTDVGRFMHSVYHSLKKGGLLAVVDNVVPGSLSAGKSANARSIEGRYINAFEQLRDPSHIKCLSEDEWLKQYYSAGIRIIHQEASKKKIAFRSWVSRSGASPNDVLKLEVMLVQAPKMVKEYLEPQFVQGELTFQLTEIILIGAKDG